MTSVIIPAAHAGVVADAVPMSTVVQNILTFVLTIAGTIGIIAIVVAGIGVLLARGDAQAQSRAKGALTFSVIGLLMVFGAFVVIRTIAGFFTGG